MDINLTLGARVITLGKQYWLLTDLEHSEILGIEEYNAIKQCTFRNLIEEDGRVRYCFYPDPKEKDFFAIDEWEIEQLVFYSIDEYLYYLVAHVDNLNNAEYHVNFETKEKRTVRYTFNDFLRDKINKSQENKPEIWI